MKNFISTTDWTKQELQDILDYAKDLKINRFNNALKNKSVALLFFNPSMRTRTSFELGVHELGGYAVVLHPGKDAWPIEFKLNSIMDGDSEEHIIEVAKVLSDYCDLIAIRAFPKFINLQEDLSDNVINSFAKYASVPRVSPRLYLSGRSARRAPLPSTCNTQSKDTLILRRYCWAASGHLPHGFTGRVADTRSAAFHYF